MRASPLHLLLALPGLLATFASPAAWGAFGYPRQAHSGPTAYLMFLGLLLTICFRGLVGGTGWEPMLPALAWAIPATMAVSIAMGLSIITSHRLTGIAGMSEGQGQNAEVFVAPKWTLLNERVGLLVGESSTMVASPAAAVIAVAFMGLYALAIPAAILAVVVVLPPLDRLGLAMMAVFGGFLAWLMPKMAWDAAWHCCPGGMMSLAEILGMRIEATRSKSGDANA